MIEIRSTTPHAELVGALKRELPGIVAKHFGGNSDFLPEKVSVHLCDGLDLPSNVEIILKVPLGAYGEDVKDSDRAGKVGHDIRTLVPHEIGISFQFERVLGVTITYPAPTQRITA